jgi:hypothetical protein
VNDDEIELAVAWRDARTAFVDAKTKAAKAAKKGESYKDDPDYQATAATMDELRTQWRRIGEAVGVRNPVPPIAKEG